MFPVLWVSVFGLKNNKTVGVLNPVQAYLFFKKFRKLEREINKLITKYKIKIPIKSQCLSRSTSILRTESCVTLQGYFFHLASDRLLLRWKGWYLSISHTHTHKHTPAQIHLHPSPVCTNGFSSWFSLGWAKLKVTVVTQELKWPLTLDLLHYPFSDNLCITSDKSTR